MRTIPSSELIVNADGSIFHLHIKPEHLADTVILVGDPDRVNLVASFFDSVECDISSREFHTMTGMYKGKRISCISHGIGTDNIDIVVNELDALVNIDLETRQEKADKKQLTLVRIGTSGGLQPHCPIGTYVVSERSIGFDGVINYYETPDDLLDLDYEAQLVKDLGLSNRLAAPYVVSADKELVERIGFDMVKGVTISAPGFYGPQGRVLRLPLSHPNMIQNIEDFKYKDGSVITNFEMESSALAALGGALGHKAMTVCGIIAGRYAGKMNTNYKDIIKDLVQIVLDRV